MTADDDYSTILHQRFDPTPAPTAKFTLVVIEGADSGKRFVVAGDEPSQLLLGHRDTCDFCVNDPAVSRRHLALDVVGASLRICDLDSSNGSSINGVRIAEALLSGDELVRVGSTTLRVQREASTETPTLPLALGFGRLIGASREMRRIYPLLEKLAAADIAVLIEGETGTGKELVAEALHETSAQAQGPFVVFDCTAVPESLMESELFGHERGAFTGATASKPGLFELAHGGTLFIDEIGELDRALQPKLLRALEKLEIRRLGGQRTTRVDVRVIAATNRNLDVEVQQGRFREDLFHRLAIARVELPALRHRRGDVPILARYFWKSNGGAADELGEEVIRRWEQYGWPGNVRELRNAVLKRLALGDLAGLPEPGSGLASRQADDAGLDEILERNLPLSRARQLVIEDFERRYLKKMLDDHGGNVRKAAVAAGVARRYFQILKARRGE